MALRNKVSKYFSKVTTQTSMVGFQIGVRHHRIYPTLKVQLIPRTTISKIKVEKPTKQKKGLTEC